MEQEGPEPAENEVKQVAEPEIILSRYSRLITEGNTKAIERALTKDPEGFIDYIDKQVRFTDKNNIDWVTKVLAVIQETARRHFPDGHAEEPFDENWRLISRNAEFKAGRKLAMYMAQLADRTDNYYISALAEDIVTTIDAVHYLFSQHQEQDRKANEAIEGYGRSKVINDQRLTDLSGSGYHLAPGLVGRYYDGMLVSVALESELGKIGNDAYEPYYSEFRYAYDPNLPGNEHEQYEKATKEYQAAFQTRFDSVPSLNEKPIDTLATALHKTTAADTDDVERFKVFASLPIRKRIEEDFDLRLSDFDLAVQYQFLNFLKLSSRQRALELASYTKKFGSDLIISFLSLEEDRHFGDAIIKIGQNYDEPTAKAIFKAYAGLFHAGLAVRDYLTNVLTERQTPKPEIVHSIVKQLLQKGQSILDYAAKMTPGEIDISRYLDGYKAELQLFANVFKTLKESGQPVELEQFQQIHLERVPGNQLTEPVKQQLLAMSSANWQPMGKLGEKITDDFQELLSNPERLAKTTFYLILHDQDVLGCFRLDTEPDGSYYFGSVNIRPEIRGSRIGETFLQQLFSEVTKGHLVRAHASPKLPITAKYLQDFGFVVTGLVDYAEPGDTWAIERDDRPIRPKPSQPNRPSYPSAVWPAAR